jgi:hypothetical protein
MINPDGSCISLGIDSASAFNPNPYQDGMMHSYYCLVSLIDFSLIGVFIAAYNGNSTDHITKYSAWIYLICDPNSVAKVSFEHLKSTLQAHFSVYTKLAC